MREVYRNPDRHQGFRRSLRSYPEKAVIAPVTGSEFSITGVIYKVVVTYQSESRGRVTCTQRFKTLKEARIWAKRSSRGDKGRAGW